MEYKKCFTLRYNPNTPYSKWGVRSYNEPLSCVFYNEKEYIDIVNKLKTFINKENKNKLKGNVYAGKGCEIPRYKLKEYITQNNLKKTNDINKADVVILDKKSIYKVLDWIESSKKDKEKRAIIKYNQELIDTVCEVDRNTTSYGLPFENTIEEINKKGKALHIIIDKKYYDNYPIQVKNVIGNIDFEDLYLIDNYRTSNQKQILGFIEECIKLNKTIVWDDYVLEQINNEGIDLDEDYLDTLKSMFESKERDNVLLALEMLNNVNINKYGLQISMLLNQYRGYFSWGNGINNQAYKTLNNYFINKGILWKEDFRIFLAGLYDNYGNDPQSKSHIENFLKDSINDILKKNKNHKKYFEVEKFDIILHKR